VKLDFIPLVPPIRSRRQLPAQYSTLQRAVFISVEHTRAAFDLRETGEFDGLAEADDRYATARRAFRPILLGQRPQRIARNTNDARRSPRHCIVVRRKDSPSVPEQSFHRFALHVRNVR